jgi:hypothetical protein
VLPQVVLIEREGERETKRRKERKAIWRDKEEGKRRK